VPVYAPVPIAWLAMGFLIDDKFARRLQSLTSLEVSFWSAAGPGSEWSLLASTMPAEKRADLLGALSQIDRQAARKATLRVGEEDYVTAFSVPETQDQNVIVTVLQKSLREELAPLR